jgi:hypothetical protein
MSTPFLVQVDENVSTVTVAKRLARAGLTLKCRPGAEPLLTLTPEAAEQERVYAQLRAEVAAEIDSLVPCGVRS